MLLGHIDRENWGRYEKIQQCYAHHPFRYWLKLAFLLLQFVLMTVLVLGGVGALLWIALQAPLKHLQLVVLLGLNGFWTVWAYLERLNDKPWHGMLYLEPHEYPELYEKVNWIAEIMRAPKIHRIYLNDQFNAAVSSSFPLIPGLRRNVLMLGYPLLCAFSSRAMTAVLAHEIGHVAGGHVWWKSVLYRIGIFWPSVQLGIFTWIFGPWIRYFQRTLSIVVHPLHCRAEIAADHYISEHFGRREQLECHALFAVRGGEWDGGEALFRHLSCSEGEPDYAVLVRELVRHDLSEAELLRLLRKAAEEVPAVDDEHPSFRERTGNLPLDQLLPFAAVAPDALEKLIGKHRSFFDQVNQYYREKYGEYIDMLREQQRAQTDELKRFPAETAGAVEWLEHILALVALKRDDEADAVRREACRRFPESLTLRGLLLIAELDAAADEDRREAIVGELKQMLKAQPLLIQELHDPLMSCYERHGMTDEIKLLLEWRETAIVRLNQWFAKPFSAEDDLRPMPLDREDRNELVEWLSGNAAYINGVYAIRRYYSPNVQAARSFLLLRVQSRFLALKGPKEVLREYEDVGWADVQIATPELQKLMAQKGIDPILITRSARSD